MSEVRSFLLLQGPIGPFFAELTGQLRREGHKVLKVNLSGGDEACCPGENKYTSTLKNWAAELLKMNKVRRFTDLVLFGDRRVYHEIAIEILSDANPNIRVWVFEEGYYRPHWITLDHYGSNVRTHLPKSAEELDAWTDPGAVDTSNMIKIDGWMKEAAFDIGKYVVGQAVKSFKFPDFKYHRNASGIYEASLWLMKLALERTYINPEADLKRFRAAAPEDFFIVAMQLEDDMQFRHYSPMFSSNAQVLERCIHNFAQHARDGQCLVFKAHPLDCLWPKLAVAAGRLADEYGMRDRIFFLNKVPFGELLNKASGLVTINSTSALLAMDHGIPVKALGQAFWDFEPLTSKSQSLEEFWNAPRPINPHAYAKFKRVIMHHTQINGSFYTKEGRRAVMPVVVERLTTGHQDTRKLSAPYIESLREKRKASAANKIDSGIMRPNKINISV